MTEFAEFPMRDDVAPYPRHDAMRAYFRDYARHFDLYRRFEFNTRVLNVEPDGAGWLVTVEASEEGPLLSAQEYADANAGELA